MMMMLPSIEAQDGNAANCQENCEIHTKSKKEDKYDDMEANSGDDLYSAIIPIS